jgi:hypothetical protein
MYNDFNDFEVGIKKGIREGRIKLSQELVIKQAEKIALEYKQEFTDFGQLAKEVEKLIDLVYLLRDEKDS